MEQKITTSWMWLSGGGINGLNVDKQRRLLRWYDEIGCACNDDDWAFEQPAREFLEKGAPGHIVNVPDDVMTEIRQTAEMLTTEE